jgi:hypothetical protein
MHFLDPGYQAMNMAGKQSVLESKRDILMHSGWCIPPDSSDAVLGSLVKTLPPLSVSIDIFLHTNKGMFLYIFTPPPPPPPPPFLPLHPHSSFQTSSLTDSNSRASSLGLLVNTPHALSVSLIYI